MKRLAASIIVTAMLALPGCTIALGGSTASPPPGGGTSSTVDGGGQSAGAANDTGGSNGTVTVHGTVVSRDTGQPYPKAWVRFSYLTSATTEYETHAYTDSSGSYSIQLPGAGQYGATAGDDCDLNISADVYGRSHFDDQVTVSDGTEIDFVAYEVTPGASIPGVC
jgi:hypothetical protein